MSKNKKQVSKLSKLVSENIRASACLTFSIIALIGILLTYYFLPILLNYGPGTIDTQFDLEFSSGLSYTTQFIIVYILVTFLGIVFLLWQTKDFKYLDSIKKSSQTDSASQKKLNKIILKCIEIPNYMFTLASILPGVLVTLIFLFLGFTSFADVKVILVIVTISLLSGSLSYIFEKNIFKSVLISIGNTQKFDKSDGSLTKSLILQITSLILVCTLYTFLLSYSTNMEDKSEVLRQHYIYEVNSIVNNYFPSNIEDLKKLLSTMELISPKDAVFLIDENNNFINFNNTEVTDFFIKYATDLSQDYDNNVYDYYGTESQGIVIPIKIDNSNIKVVIRYDLSSSNLGTVFPNLIIILLYCAASVFFISHSISKEIARVATSMNNISSGSKAELNDKLPVTSNDEIGELIRAFNEIQDLTKQNIEQIEGNQQTLLEQERLASLGQMIGGIAHNMKTPIMSISGASEALTDLISEYMASIDNPSVTSSDHKEIATDMLSWITKIKSHTAYMSDIITTVKGQASQLTTMTYSTFTVYDLSKKVEILIKHEIKKALLTLEISLNCDPTLKLHGDINNLIQVVINLISNSIQAYDGKTNEKVFLSIDADESNVYIRVKDNASGISEEVQSKLFKEMVTTKGKNGTGLGLYLSYSTIRGKFGGDITFESKENIGTTFTISLPLNI